MKVNLEEHVPAAAVVYCNELRERYPFHFKLAGNRKSKAGDYRYDPRLKSHTITVNRSLNTYAFLITYIHEVAHQVAYLEYGRKISPHGQEWRHTFKRLMAPLLTPEVFPDTLLKVLARHMIIPKASTHADSKLVKELMTYDGSDSLILDDLSEGSTFYFRGKEYVKRETRRTRVLCSQVHGTRRYLISRVARVEV